MDAVSTASLYKSALLNITNAEQAESEATAQAGSEKVATDLQGYGSSASTLTASNTLNAQLTAYIGNAQTISSRLSVQDSALTSLSSTTQGATTAISDAIGTNDATGLMSALEVQFGQAASTLNTQYDGKYLFAGGQVNTQPFTATSLTSLGGGTVASFFKNDQNATTNRLNSDTVLTTGVVASNVGQPLIQAMQDLQALNAGPNGPLNGTLTTAQAAGLQSVLTEFKSALTSANAAVGQNGVVQNQVSSTQAALTDQQTALTGVIGNITDVDIAQVATNLNLAQTALQASAQVFSSLQTDSLLNVLSSSA